MSFGCEGLETTREAALLSCPAEDKKSWLSPGCATSFRLAVPWMARWPEEELLRTGASSASSPRAVVDLRKGCTVWRCLELYDCREESTSPSLSYASLFHLCMCSCISPPVCVYQCTYVGGSVCGSARRGESTATRTDCSTRVRASHGDLLWWMFGCLCRVAFSFLF